MRNYSIVRSGREYIVQADEKSVLKIASRRRALRLVACAAQLLDAQAAQPAPPQADSMASIARDPRVIPDPRVISGAHEVP
jgi:hypothetical protein